VSTEDAERIRAARDEVIGSLERGAATAGLDSFQKGELRALRQHATPEQQSRLDQLLNPRTDTGDLATESAYKRGARRARERSSGGRGRIDSPPEPTHDFR
jgi:hypothetical protein